MSNQKTYWAHPGDLFEDQDPEIFKARGWMEVVLVRDLPDTRQPAPSAEADRLAEAVAALPHYYPYVSYEVGDGPTVGMDVDSDGDWFLRADVEDILAAYQKSKEAK